MKRQVMFSGGVESSSLLKWLLLNTNDEIIAHFVELSNIFEPKAKCERAATQALMPHLQKIRPFKYIESAIEIDSGKARMMDHEALFFIALQTHRRHQCDYSYRALCYEDQFNQATGKHNLLGKHGNHTSKGYHQHRVKCLRGMMRPHENEQKMFPFHETMTWHKHEHMAYLGELLPLTWSCRTPMNFEPCGKCAPCLQRRTQNPA